MSSRSFATRSSHSSVFILESRFLSVSRAFVLSSGKNSPCSICSRASMPSSKDILPRSGRIASMASSSISLRRSFAFSM